MRLAGGHGWNFFRRHFHRVSAEAIALEYHFQRCVRKSKLLIVATALKLFYSTGHYGQL